jgi:hypothetical protein
MPKQLKIVTEMRVPVDRASVRMAAAILSNIPEASIEGDDDEGDGVHHVRKSAPGQKLIHRLDAGLAHITGVERLHQTADGGFPPCPRFPLEDEEKHCAHRHAQGQGG